MIANTLIKGTYLLIRFNMMIMGDKEWSFNLLKQFIKEVFL